MKQRKIDPQNPPGPKPKPDPYRWLKLGQFLVAVPHETPPRPFVWLLVDGATISIALAGGELVIEHPDSVRVATTPDVESAARKASIDGGWWRPTIETERFALVAECPQCHCYRVQFSTNQRIESMGDLEEIITRGILDWHKARGEKPPTDGIPLAKEIRA